MLVPINLVLVTHKINCIIVCYSLIFEEMDLAQGPSLILYMAQICRSTLKISTPSCL